MSDGRGAIEAALSVSIVVSKGKQFFMALLQRFEPCQPFIDRDLSHSVTCLRCQRHPTTTMPSSSHGCQTIFEIILRLRRLRVLLEGTC